MKVTDAYSDGMRERLTDRPDPIAQRAGYAMKALAKTTRPPTSGQQSVKRSAAQTFDHARRGDESRLQ